MKQYKVLKHDEKAWRDAYGYGFIALMDDALGWLNLGSRLWGIVRTVTDPRSRNAKDAGAVRFVVPRSCTVTHNVVVGDVIEYLNSVGIRTHTRTHSARYQYFVVRGTQSNGAIAAVQAWEAGKPWTPWGDKAKAEKPQPLPTPTPKGKRPSKRPTKTTTTAADRAKAWVKREFA